MMRIPLATYRIQFTPEFGFKDAEDIVTYLANLGISDLYASPVFRARQASPHGYDLVDPTQLNPDLGSETDFHSLASALRQQDMGWLQDTVPNHMAFDAQNPCLADVLENGPDSAYGHFFDIDWEHYYEMIRGKVLAPFLVSYYGEALENGEIQLCYGESGFIIRYHTLSFPLRIETYLTVLVETIPRLRRALGEDHADYIQMLGILYVVKTLSSSAANGERGDQVRFVKQNLWALYRHNPSIRKGIDGVVRLFNGHRNKPESFNRLESLLADQFFRLSFWKVACEEINYRRFFSINDLISLKVEREEVFNQTHALLLKLVREGHVTGLRIDHVDGLYDPAVYLQRLREASPQAFIVVEKILAAGEPLPLWPVQGTTGYDFLNTVNGVFCAVAAEKAFSVVYHRFSGLRQPCAELVYASKKLIIERHLFGDVNNLAHLLKNIATRYRYGSDITMDSLKRALMEVLAAFPVYRTYLDPAGIREFDLRAIDAALKAAVKRNPGYQIEIDFIGRVLIGQADELLPEEDRAQWSHFAMRFQQMCGPLMAKGLEDTLFYVYARLLSLNEVGGDPTRFGVPPEGFHAFCQERYEMWPHTLNATATHDSKRGEDVRARLNVLSELPREWSHQIRAWNRMNQAKKTLVGRSKVPDKNDEYLFYQTLVGAWPVQGDDDPDFLERMKSYLIKAVREAKVHTNWLKPDTDYEEGFLRFVGQVLAPHPGNLFLESFTSFQRRIAHFGRLNSLSQTLLKITAPGIPDFYQGCEVWDLTLVDPDNRRTVDYRRRRQVLRQIMAGEQTDLPGLIGTLLADMRDGRVKMFLIRRALETRRRHARLFQEGCYQALDTAGIHHENILAFARVCDDDVAVTVVPRLLAGWLEDGQIPLGTAIWGDTLLQFPNGDRIKWKNVLTGATFVGRAPMNVGDILGSFPVALLVGKRGSRD